MSKKKVLVADDSSIMRMSIATRAINRTNPFFNFCLSMAIGAAIIGGDSPECQRPGHTGPINPAISGSGDFPAEIWEANKEKEPLKSWAKKKGLFNINPKKLFNRFV